LTFGHQKRDFIYVSDVVEAYLKVIKFSLENSFRYRVFNVGNGKSIQVREMIEKIKILSNSDTILNFGTLPYRCDEIMNPVADTVELENIGWKSEFTTDEGLSKIIKYYKSNNLK
ncbi:MAG: hypothetical protein BWK75_05970, partial [Candidatus Altiarchaeales archaeon A3]